MRPRPASRSRSNVTTCVRGFAGSYDLVVSNPPYVGAAEIEQLEPEVRDWEPRLATVGEEHTELIARAARSALRPGGWLVLEVADGRGAATADRLRELGYEQTRARPDLTGRDRVVEGRWRKIEQAVEAIQSGRPVILPTDTVYGLCASPYREEPVPASTG